MREEPSTPSTSGPEEHRSFVQVAGSYCFAQADGGMAKKMATQNAEKRNGHFLVVASLGQKMAIYPDGLIPLGTGSTTSEIGHVHHLSCSRQHLCPGAKGWKPRRQGVELHENQFLLDMTSIIYHNLFSEFCHGFLQSDISQGLLPVLWFLWLGLLRGH